MYQNPKTLLIVLVISVICISAHAQIRLTGHAGAGMLEHLSLGVGCNFGARHSVAALYGSNLFINTHRFSNYLLQYHYNFPGLSIRNVTPIAGMKGGRSVYSDDYYTWTVITAVPFVGFQIPLNNQIDLTAHGGVSLSFEQAAKRLSYGEIGHYRSTLPEARLGLVYRFKKKNL